MKTRASKAGDIAKAIRLLVEILMFQTQKTDKGIGIRPLPELPILEKREEIIQKIKDHQVVVVLGETGCGKTTMIPLFLLEAGLGYFGRIGVTEPRRIAAFSLMPYVSGFIDSDKKIVGGHTRFWNTTNADTQIEYMTDGILMEEMLYDPELTEYSTIMIDEAHERSQNIDYILGHLKNIRRSRPELRIIIASATIDALKFSKFFDDAPIIEVPGRTYPVEIIYDTVPHFSKETFKPRNAPLEVARKIAEIHESGQVGDILAFLPGRNEIGDCIELLKKREFADMEILAAYGHMDLTEQAAIFLDYPGKRKVIIATNVAETSITPVGVKFIVDPGLIKQMDFYANSGRSSLQTKPHSRSGVNQRAGRAGRTQNGVCYRLYTEEEYNALPEFTKPEICRTSLDSIILNMRFIGIQDIEHFPFIDLPSHALFRTAYESLKKMGSLDKNEALTDHGKMMAKLPLEPVLGHMLLMSQKYGCVEQIATIAAAISASHIMLRPPEEEEMEKADKAHKRFESPVSDAITFLNIWEEYKQHEGDTEWCLENYMNEKALIEMRDIHEQLLEMLAEFGIQNSSTDNMEKVLKAIAVGLADNLFKAKEEEREGSDDRRKGKRGESRRTGGSNTYFSVTDEKASAPVFIHPGSSTFGSRPAMLVALEVVRTTKEFMRMCSMVDPSWLPELFPKKFSKKEKVLTGMKSGSKGAYVKSVVHSDNAVVGTMNEKISLADARKIQKENIAKAIEEGCEKLYFKKRKTKRGGLYVVMHGHEYEPSRNSLVEPKEGITYYAFLRTEKVGKSNRHFADVRFQVFDFKEEAKQEKRRAPKKANGKKRSS